ncbi:MAG: hypothetical protein JWO38_7004 [Gemmataceae bacterium]|nr:hypothetical protein [Gemmataceae bacterium]
MPAHEVQQDAAIGRGRDLRRVFCLRRSLPMCLSGASRPHFFLGVAFFPLARPRALAAGLTTFFSAAFTTVLAASFTASAAVVTGPFFAGMSIPLPFGRSSASRGTYPAYQHPLTAKGLDTPNRVIHRQRSGPAIREGELPPVPILS